MIEKLVVGANKEYRLQAALSAEGQIVPRHGPAEERKGQSGLPVKEKTKAGELVRIVPGVLMKYIEIIPGEESVLVTIRPAHAMGRRFAIESGDIAALTDAEVEIEDDRLFIRQENVKAQIRFLPSAAHAKVKESGISELQDIQLVVKDKRPVYLFAGSESGRLLALIPVKVPVAVDVDAETGEVRHIGRPFWSFLVLRA
jgi:hypothetical protein